jgi:hypothetical protein
MGLEGLGNMAMDAFKGMGGGLKASGEGLASFFNMMKPK